MKGRKMDMQAALIHVPIKKDIVFTPRWLAKDMVDHFQPNGRCLDPCKGNGAFFDLLPVDRDWCEIELGRDFYAWQSTYDWIIGNPPYSNLLAWIRHSMSLGENIAYLIPLHRVFSSAEFIRDVREWGGIRAIRFYGTGTEAGFPFGHALAAVHWQVGFSGDIEWSDYEV